MAKREVAYGGKERQRQWRERLRRFERSGLSVAEFCQAESVSAWSLYNWRRRLSVGSGRVRRVERPRGGFVEVGTLRVPKSEAAVLDPTPVAAPAGMQLRIELGGGLVLQLSLR